MVIGAPIYQRSLSAELELARAALADADALAEQAGVEHESEILEGDAARKIAELAQARDAGLIVVGSRGRGAITGALLGSVSVQADALAPTERCSSSSNARAHDNRLPDR